MPVYQEGVDLWKLELIPRDEGEKTVLDLGCGVTTPYRQFLEKLGFYVALDIRASKRVTLVADCRMIPIRDKSIDFLWCSELIEHLDRSGQERTVGEIIRVLRGRAVITYPTERHVNFPKDPTHKPVEIDWEKIVEPRTSYRETDIGEAIVEMSYE